jgi:hypothetical protein
MKKLLLCSFPIVFLISCTTTTPLTLTSVKAEVVAIDTVVDTIASIAEAKNLLPINVVQYVNNLDTASKIIEGLTVGSNATTDIQAFSSDLNSIIAVLPIPDSTKTEIELGLSVIDAFASGATTSPVISSPTLNASVSIANPNEYGTPIVPITLPLDVK